MSSSFDIFVGTDRSQLLAVAVLEYSVKRHTRERVRLCPLMDLGLPEPKDIRQGSRTNFSFARFAIPELKNFEGRALYLDADMLVFQDIAELWRMPFDGAKIIIQSGVESHITNTAKVGAPKSRKKQCSVMMMDCSRLDWDARKIIAGLDGEYDYDQLLGHMCILKEEEVSYSLPFQWNSLEHFDDTTCLIHYTDMHTQPWVDPLNRNGHLWLREVRRMIEEGVISRSAVEQEIDLGYFRPSLLKELEELDENNGWNEASARRYMEMDKAAGFVKHAEVYTRKRAREAAVKAYEADLTRQRAA